MTYSHNRRPREACVYLLIGAHAWRGDCCGARVNVMARRAEVVKLFEPQGLIIILVIVLVIFGPKRLPELGKSLGNTLKGFREATEGKLDAEETENPGEE